MKLTNDESRALAFIAGLLLLSAAVRVGAAREPVEIPGAAGGAGFDAAAHLEATRAAVAAAERASRPLGEGERIDPNTADAVELDRLPRVGPALAARIVEDRERNGRFRWVGDLRRVRGIGERMLEEIRPHIALPTTEPSPAASAPRRRAAAAAARAGASSGPAAASAAASADGGGSSGGLGPAGPVDLNRADAAALATLPGIGPVLAARIVAYRDSVGPFRDVEALLAVRGVGPATLERLRPLVTAGGL